uniref:DUF5388 domain-containing protein n=1 Tax=Lacticaseibacillus paracasei TaxID=1597 RepID=UPI00403EF919
MPHLSIIAQTIFVRNYSIGALVKNVTYPANIRVDNHVRNQISALQNLGLGNSAKDIVHNLVAERVEQLDSPTAKRYQEMVDILEQMDAYKQTEKTEK